jgi:hypothetical protein
MALLLWALLLLNAFDCFSTTVMLGKGLASEANPIMAWCYQLAPWAFVAFKACASAALTGLFWKMHEWGWVDRWAWAWLWFITLAYTALVLYQTYGFWLAWQWGYL